jgi:quercetin dioxygenase-like cupin family protein
MSYSMRRRLFWLVLASLAQIVGSLLWAQGAEQRLRPDEIPWSSAATAGVGTSGVGAVQTIVLIGDPSKAELYSLLLRVGPNVTIEAHSHADDRVAAVLSGTWYFGYGREFDERALKELPAGSVYTEPPAVEHFAMTKEEGAVIQITGFGPSGTTYVDSANDPAR